MNNAADLLTSTFASGLPQQCGFQVPYQGFPLGATLAQALRPYPQLATIFTEFSPVGNSGYDSLQAKVTKRFSQGLQMLTSFTWSKNLERGTDVNRGRGAPINDSLNYAVNKVLSPESQPFVIATNFTYQIPTPTALGKNRFVRQALGEPCNPIPSGVKESGACSFACVQRAAALLTSGWPLPFGSPSDLNFRPAG